MANKISMMPFLNRYIEIPNCRKLYLNRRYEILYIRNRYKWDTFKA